MHECFVLVTFASDILHVTGDNGINVSSFCFWSKHVMENFSPFYLPEAWRGKSVSSGWYSFILLITLLFPVKARTPWLISLAIFFNTNPFISTQFSTGLNKYLPVVVSCIASTRSNSSLSSKWGCVTHINTKLLWCSYRLVL